MYKRVLLKLSGEAISDKDFPFNVDFLDYLAKQIKYIQDRGVQVGIVVGGGNICRGRSFKELGFDMKKADYVGMCATVINAQMLGAALLKNNVKTKVFTKYPVKNVEDYDQKKAINAISRGYVCVFGGGTGKPFFSTDTACAQRAKDIKAEVILFAKNGTDGVYDKDPRKYKNAKRIDELSFDDIIEKNLQVIDIAAAKILRKEKIQGFVFDMAAKDAIKKSIDHKIVGTVIK